MKKILLSLLVLSSLQAYAGQMMIEEGPVTKDNSPLCITDGAKFAEYTSYLKNIYRSGKAARQNLLQILVKNDEANNDCNKRFKNSRQAEVEMSYKETRSIMAQCDLESILTPEKKDQYKAAYDELAYLNQFPTELSFTSMHSTSLKITCEDARAKIERLRQLIELK